MIMAQNHLHATFERTDQLNPQKYRNNEFEIGSPVLVRNFRKIMKSDPKFIKGFVITEKVNEYTYQVKNERTENVTKYHVNDLKNDYNDPYYLEREIRKIREEGSRNDDDFDDNENDENEEKEEVKESDPSDRQNIQTDQLPDVPSGRSLRPRKDLRKPDRLNL